MSTDTGEKGPENLIVEAMTGVPGSVDSTQGGARKPPTSYSGTGWLPGNAQQCDRAYAIRFLRMADKLTARLI